MSSVSLIVPTLNEAENVDLLLNRIFAIEELRELDFEIVFSDGASDDDTCATIKKWQDDHPVKLVESDVNRGLSAAVIAGAAVAKGDYVLVMDADLSHPPEKIPDLLHPLLAGTYDMVIGSRYVAGGSTPDWPATRKISSVLATLPARVFTDVKDPLAGFFCLRRDRLVNLAREVSGFKIGLELLATEEHPFRVKEVPITFRDRCYGDSKMGLAVIRDYVRQLLLLVGINWSQSLSLRMILSLILMATASDYCLSLVCMALEMSPIVASWISYPLTCCLTGWFLWFYTRKSGKVDSSRAMFLILITAGYGCVLLLFLRSAIVLQYGIPKGGGVNLFLISFVSVVAGYLAAVCFVFSIGRKRISGELVIRFYLIAAVFYLFFLRLVYVNLIPFSQEEISLIEKYRTGLDGSFLLPDLLHRAVYKGAMFLSGASPFGLRFAALGVWWIVLICMFNHTRDVLDRSVAFKTTLIFSVLPFTFFGTFGYTDETILILAWSGSLYVLYRYLVVGARRAWLFGALGPVLAVGYEPFCLVLLIGSVIYIALNIRNSSYRAKHQPLLWGMLVLVFSVLLVLAGGFSRFNEAYNGLPWLAHMAGFHLLSSSPVLLFVMLTPIPICAAIFCMFKCGEDGDLARYPYTDLFFFEKKMFFLLLFILPLIIGFIMAIITEEYYWCSSFVWLGALPCISLTYTKPGNGNSGKVQNLLYQGWWMTVLLLIMIYGGILLYHAL